MSEQIREYELGMHPELPPPNRQSGLVKWVMDNLFPSVGSGIITVICLIFLYYVIPPLFNWAFWDSVVFNATSREECYAINDGKGACWAFIYRRWDQFVYGFYPEAERWRVNISFILLAMTLVIVLAEKVRKVKGIMWLVLILPIICAILIPGSELLGLTPVPTNKFGGFMLTLIIGMTGIFVSLPIGIGLALARISSLPIFSVFATLFIEFIRGVPLITLLFIASTLLSYFLPPGTNFDLLVRVLIMVTIFSAAYLAEVIRGGLAAIPRGQYEAADALGLSYWKSMRLVILPQALKISIPGIVSSFIGLFKDTTLVVIIGLLDPLGIGAAAIADIKWTALGYELYVFIAVFFFICCFGMSRYSLYLERKLHTGH